MRLGHVPDPVTHPNRVTHSLYKNFYCPYGVAHSSSGNANSHRNISCSRDRLGNLNKTSVTAIRLREYITALPYNAISFHPKPCVPFSATCRNQFQPTSNAPEGLAHPDCSAFPPHPRRMHSLSAPPFTLPPLTVLPDPSYHARCTS